MFQLKKGGLCPQCEKGKLGELIKDLEFKYKGSRKVFQQEKVFVCDLCGYEGLTQETNKRIEKDLTDFRRSVEGLLTSDRMRSIRENLGFNKKEMARLLTVNEKTIGRYESGKITQSEQIDKLYRIYGAYPSIARRIDIGKPTFRVRAIVKIKAREIDRYVISAQSRYTYSVKAQHSRKVWEAKYAEAA